MEGKNSFVLYTDLLEIVEVLSDEQAGLLFKTVLRYVNDKNPVIPKEIQLAFIPIKQSLKRDLDKWKDSKERRAEAGRKGGLAKSSNAKQCQAMESNDNQCLANQAVSVSVNDNVNVNGSVNVNEVYIPQPEVSDVPKKETKHKFGKYGRVLLTTEQHRKLVEEFGMDTITNYITQLDEYVESNGNKNKYKDFNLVLRKAIRENWFKKSVFSSLPQSGTTWASAEELPAVSDEEIAKLKQKHEEEERMRGYK